MVEMNDLVSTREAAALLGVGPSAIKRWADAGKLACFRTAGGHRRYRRRDLTALAQRRDNRKLAVVNGDAPTLGKPKTSHEGRAFLDLLLSANGAYLAEGALLQARGERESWAAVADYVGAELSELGRRWAVGEIGVLDEHLSSAHLGRALGRIASSIRVPAGAPVAFLLTMPGDDHTLGLSLAELCFLEAGWACRWAGRGSPIEEVVACLKSGGIDLVAASASQYSANSEALAQWATTIADVCATSAVDLVLGGAGAWPETLSYGVRLNEFQQLADHLQQRRPVAL